MMTTETTDTQLQPTQPVDSTPQYTFETLPPLSIQQSKMLDAILQGYNYTQAYRMANYSADEHAHTAAWNMVNRYPLKAHVDYYLQEMGKRCTVEYKIGFLNRIAEQCVNPDNVIKAGDTAIKAIDLMAKIQGHHAPTNVQVASVTGSIEDIRRAKSEYIKDK